MPKYNLDCIYLVQYSCLLEEGNEKLLMKSAPLVEVSLFDCFVLCIPALTQTHRSPALASQELGLELFFKF